MNGKSLKTGTFALCAAALLLAGLVGAAEKKEGKKKAKKMPAVPEKVAAAVKNYCPNATVQKCKKIRKIAPVLYKLKMACPCIEGKKPKTFDIEITAAGELYKEDNHVIQAARLPKRVCKAVAAWVPGAKIQKVEREAKEANKRRPVAVIYTVQVKDAKGKTKKAKFDPKGHNLSAKRHAPAKKQVKAAPQAPATCRGYCPKCKKMVDAVCPKCGTKLRPSDKCSMTTCPVGR